jgi:hypothetical protein
MLPSSRAGSRSENVGPTVPTVQILHPSNYMSLVDGQPVTVAGQATDRGGAEPVLIDSVTLQVDGGTPVRATLTRSHDATHTIANFTATVTVGGASGPHTITATATNDSNISVRRSVTVFIGPVFQTAAPAILLDVEVPFDVDANDRSVQSLLANIQHGLVPISDVLAASGMLLAGPNLQVIPNGALSLLRLGLWIEPNTFPVQPPTGDMVLPLLSDAAAVASFALVPLLPRPHRTSLSDMPFAVRIAATGLQNLADAALASSDNDDVNSISVSMVPPSTVVTRYSGDVIEGTVPFTITVAEVLGTAAVVGAIPPVTAPVVATSRSSTVGDLPEWLFGAIVTIVGIGLLATWYKVSEKADQTGGVAAPLLSDLPVEIPFSNTLVPIDSLPDFPVLVADWSTLGVTADGILGGADATIQARDQSVVGLAIGGPDFVQVPPGEFVASMTYRIELTNIAPDPGALTWQLRSPITNTTSTGTVEVGAFAQTAFLNVDFPMPLHLSPGTYRYTLSVAATETCGTDPSKRLTAAASKDINVKLPAQHKPPLGPPTPIPVAQP